MGGSASFFIGRAIYLILRALLEMGCSKWNYMIYYNNGLLYMCVGMENGGITYVAMGSRKIAILSV